MLHAGALALVLVTYAPLPPTPNAEAMRLFEVAAVAKQAEAKPAVTKPRVWVAPPVAAVAVLVSPAAAVATVEMVTSRAPTEVADNVRAPPAAVLAEPLAAPLDVGGATRRDAYAQLLWRHIAARRPPGIPAHGTAVVAFMVDRSGEVHDAVIAQSSGNTMLDRIALRSVRLAAPMPAPPRDFADDALRFSLPFSFG